MKKGWFVFFSGILGIFLIFPAILKFISLEFFELNLVETGFIGWNIAPFAARSIIALELFLGLLLLFRVWLKGFAYPATFFLILFFTCYLIFEWITHGNSKNCNCFGTILPLSTNASVVKNLLLIFLILILWRFDMQKEWRCDNWLLVIFSVVSFGFPYIANPVTIYEPAEPVTGQLTKKLNLEAIYSGPSIARPVVDLRKGKHILACATLKCPHCIIECYKLHLIRKKNPEVSIYLFLNGKLKDLPDFIRRTRTSDIPHLMLPGKKFIPLTGYQVPTIFFLEDGEVVMKVNYLQLDRKEVYNWSDKK